MEIRSILPIYFSPTRTTQKIVMGIAKALAGEIAEHLDLTAPAPPTRSFGKSSGELAVIGAPVYSGRIPPVAVKRLTAIKAQGTPAVVVVVYGNREYEDALLELKNLALDMGFVPVAAGAFIGEHSFSGPDTPIAPGRPDGQDMDQVERFGRMITDKLKSAATPEALQVPGNFPYKAPGGSNELAPVTLENLCTLCETCAGVCPTGAITVTDAVVTDPKGCILCCACVKNCPTEARQMQAPPIREIAQWLTTNFGKRKAPELFV